MQNRTQTVTFQATPTTAVCYGQWSIFSNSNGLKLWPHHWLKSPSFLLLVEMYILAKTPPYKLISSSLMSMIKTDHCHGLVAHSPQVPLYSTLFLITKLGIILVLSINLSTLINTTHVTIKQKDQVLVMYFHHCSTMMSIYLYAGLLTSILLAAYLKHTYLPLIKVELLNNYFLCWTRIMFDFTTHPH